MRPWTLRRIATRLARRYYQYLLRSRAAPGSVHDRVGGPNRRFFFDGLLAVVGGDRVALVVAPLAADEQVARREALEPEAGRAGQRDGGVVGRLDVRLDAVQAE